MQTMSWPQLPPELRELADLKTAVIRDEVLSGFAAHSQDLSGVQARATVIREATCSKCTFAQAGLEKLSLTDVTLQHCDMVASNCAESSWKRVAISDTRASGLKVQTSVLTDVSFVRCKLDLTNFRFSKLKNILFKDCSLDEADFYNAELDNVSFSDCTLTKTVFSGTKCKHVDLRSSDITDIVGVEGLAGTIIDSVQLVSLAPLLANHLGIQVNDQ